MTSTFHMIEYIRDNPTTLHRTLADNEKAVQTIVDHLQTAGVQRVVVVGNGSSYTASMIAAPVFRYHCSVPTYILPATEIEQYGERLVDEHTLIIAVSRSGERDWVVNTLKNSIERGAFGVAMTGAADSLLAQSGQLILLTSEGPEITFPKTKSVTACTGLLMRLALALASPDDQEAAERLSLLFAMPEAIHRIISDLEPAVSELIDEIKKYEPVIVVGTGSNYGVSLEAALKMQETAYVPMHADDTGNLLHGPLAALNANWLIISLIKANDLKLSRELLGLVSHFGAHRLNIVEPGLDLQGLSDHVLTLPESGDPLLAGLLYLPVVQLLTYYWAVAKELNPDTPTGMRAILDTILPPGREEPELR